MIRPPDHPLHGRNCNATLLLNGQDVGTVHTRRWSTSWGFGDFSPNTTFSRFAPLYGRWSLLMHAEDDRDQLSRDAIEELAEAEAMLDGIRAQLIFENDPQAIDVATLIIDGDEVEWKEY